MSESPLCYLESDGPHPLIIVTLRSRKVSLTVTVLGPKFDFIVSLLLP